MHWLEILKRLRKEQNREYYKEENRPALQLPLPIPAPKIDIEPPPPKEEERGVIIIDMFSLE